MIFYVSSMILNELLPELGISNLDKCEFILKKHACLTFTSVSIVKRRSWQCPN